MPYQSSGVTFKKKVTSGKRVGHFQAPRGEGVGHCRHRSQHCKRCDHFFKIFPVPLCREGHFQILLCPGEGVFESRHSQVTSVEGRGVGRFSSFNAEVYFLREPTTYNFTNGLVADPSELNSDRTPPQNSEVRKPAPKGKKA